MSVLGVASVTGIKPGVEAEVVNAGEAGTED
jgi:hypothetical protein